MVQKSGGWSPRGISPEHPVLRRAANLASLVPALITLRPERVPRSAPSRVVHGATALREVAEHLQALLAQHAVGDEDAATGELAEPIRMDGALVEAGDVFQRGPAARDHHRA